MMSDSELFVAFLVMIERKRDNASTQAMREFWHRLAGSIRKASTML